MNYTKLLKSEHTEVTQMQDTFHLQNSMSETCISDVSRSVEMRATAGNLEGGSSVFPVGRECPPPRQGWRLFHEGNEIPTQWCE